MKKKLIKTTFYLLLYSSIAKILSFVVRIYLARSLSTAAMNYYSLTMPTMLLLITLAQLGIPSAMAKLIASNDNAKKTIKASIFLSILNNILIFLALALIIPLMSNLIFKDVNLIAVFFSCLPMIPLITITGLLKGYLMGRNRLIDYSQAQISEELFRILFLLLALPLSGDPVILAKLAILSMAVGELASALHMLMVIGINKKPQFSILTEKAEKPIYYAILAMALPMTFSRLIGSISFFFEPIVMLFNVDAQSHTIMIENFTLMNSYILPLITLPSFISVMLSNWALPTFSSAFSTHNKTRLKSTFFYTILFSLSIGVIWSLILTFFPEAVCQFIYNHTSMAKHLQIIALPFCIFSIQPILGVFLHACNKSNNALKGTFIGCTVRLLLICFIPIYTTEYALIIALCASMLLTTLFHFSHSLRILFFDHI